MVELSLTVLRINLPPRWFTELCVNAVKSLRDEYFGSILNEILVP